MPKPINLRDITPRPFWSRAARWIAGIDDLAWLMITAVVGGMITCSAASLILLSRPDQPNLPDMTGPETQPQCQSMPLQSGVLTRLVPDDAPDSAKRPGACVIRLAETEAA